MNETEINQHFGVRIVAVQEMKNYEIWYVDDSGENQHFTTLAFYRDGALANFSKFLDSESKSNAVA